MLNDLAMRPETAVHVCRKLAAHFIADEAPPEIVAAMVDEWKASKGHLLKVYAVMLNHPRAWADPGRKMKLPFDYVVSGLRAFGITQKNWQGKMSPNGDDEIGQAVPPTATGDANALQHGGEQAAKEKPTADMNAMAEQTANPKPKPSQARTLTLAT